MFFNQQQMCAHTKKKVVIIMYLMSYRQNNSVQPKSDLLHFHSGIDEGPDSILLIQEIELMALRSKAHFSNF